MKERWEVWTKGEGGRTKRHYNGFIEASAKHVFTVWTEDMQQASLVQLLCKGDLIGEYARESDSVTWLK